MLSFLLKLIIVVCTTTVFRKANFTFVHFFYNYWQKWWNTAATHTHIAQTPTKFLWTLNSGIFCNYAIISAIASKKNFTLKKTHIVLEEKTATIASWNECHGNMMWKKADRAKETLAISFSQLIASVRHYITIRACEWSEIMFSRLLLMEFIHTLPNNETHFLARHQFMIGRNMENS